MHLYIIAGEPSGDLLGGKLIAALKAACGADMRISGIGGETMQAEGLKSLFPMYELSLMGLAEVVPHIPRMLMRIGQTVADIREKKPDVVVTIDSPGFAFRVAEKLGKGSGIKLVHYVAPSVWAWKPERAKRVARLYDHLLALLPFEPPYFEKEGIGCTFVGHPVVQQTQGQGERFRKGYAVKENERLLAVLPGSRSGEVARLLPVFGKTVEKLTARFPGLRVVIPTVAVQHHTVQEGTFDWPVEIIFPRAEEKWDALAACNAALAKSGTVALELAMAGVPMAIAYKVHPLTAWMMRRMLHVKNVNLINLTLEREVIPELLQENCTPELLARAVGDLLENPELAGEQRRAAHEALLKLGLGNPETPSQRAARAVLEVVGGI